MLGDLIGAQIALTQQFHTRAAPFGVLLVQQGFESADLLSW
jgi:hypothetical protein